MKYNYFLFAVIALSLSSCVTTKTHWYKGNTHSHSLYSDGDSPVKNVIQWYHDNDYNFLFVTDHNYPLAPDSILPSSLNRTDFILIQGNEVSDVNGVHTTALNTNVFIPTVRHYRNGVKQGLFAVGILDSLPQSKTEILRMHIRSILEAGGIPIINHPNFISGLHVSDILPVDSVKHIEVFNGHPEVFNWGNELHQPVEQKWDSLLVNRRLFYAVASDDEHILLEQRREKANPGRGWIMVKADGLQPDKILSAVQAGDFYSSTGVVLKKYEVNGTAIKIEVDEEATLGEIKKGRGYHHEVEGNNEFKIEFVGYNGAILKTVSALKAEYVGQLGNKYMRARITYQSGGKCYYAWCQPVEAVANYFVK